MLIEVVAYDHPDAAVLVGEAQQEMVVRYGGPDGTPVRAEEFAPPLGLFLVGYEDGVPVACAGWRAQENGVELKRMYVRPAARGKGYAKRLLTEIERTALAAGNRRVALETGTRQPEAVALYRSAGYRDIPAFGYYACSPNSIYLGKDVDGSYALDGEGGAQATGV